MLPSQLVLWTGMRVFWWIGPVVILVIIPLLDWIVGEDGTNPADEDYERLSNDKFYRALTFLFLPVQLIGLIIACWLWAHHELSVIDKIGLATSVGLAGGIGINAAHELGHRSEELERWLAKIALAQSLYGHFYVEHNRGHHVRVATPDDPASARLGESLWFFFPRTVIGSFRSAVELERDRLRRKGSGWWTYQNSMLQSYAVSVVLIGGLLIGFGWAILPYLLLQGVLSIALLETVNYIEHYGLLRAKKANGSWARCSPADSWNSDRLVTNVFLFHLQRHSDHHANPGRRYQTLRTTDESPQLPGGYASMVVLALVPWIWRSVMDPKVLAHYDGDITRCNISPRKRERILAAYATV
ncbi:alkane 1-monooxygenase [Nocardia stercoris]|uniref:Alkane 1-monooxygenase n=1 Tax=Nocardia stercoris TaxID=2483361 RepID=A0A3M2LFB5_9NOCA|nr:alkane 1-monooxygenase [Nocardia stercoris]RMI35766.1 alkane 1-monooxygenase [Nocardia stercoris]